MKKYEKPQTLVLEMAMTELLAVSVIEGRFANPNSDVFSPGMRPLSSPSASPTGFPLGFP